MIKPLLELLEGGYGPKIRNTGITPVAEIRK